MIRINENLKDGEPGKVYAPDGTYVGTISNLAQLYDFRYHILNNRETGYYIMVDNKKYIVADTGHIKSEDCLEPDDFMNTHTEYSTRYLKALIKTFD